MKKENLFLSITWSAACIVLMVWIAHTGLNTPLVTYSYATKQCVQVEPASAGDCDRLPTRYSKQWSK